MLRDAPLDFKGVGRKVFSTTKNVTHTWKNKNINFTHTWKEEKNLTHMEGRKTMTYFGNKKMKPTHNSEKHPCTFVSDNF